MGLMKLLSMGARLDCGFTNDLMGLRGPSIWSDAERRAATRSTNGQRAAQFDIQ